MRKIAFVAGVLIASGALVLADTNPCFQWPVVTDYLGKPVLLSSDVMTDACPGTGNPPYIVVGCPDHPDLWDKTQIELIYCLEEYPFFPSSTCSRTIPPHNQTWYLTGVVVFAQGEVFNGHGWNSDPYLPPYNFCDIGSAETTQFHCNSLAVQLELTWGTSQSSAGKKNVDITAYDVIDSCDDPPVELRALRYITNGGGWEHRPWKKVDFKMHKQAYIDVEVVDPADEDTNEYTKRRETTHNTFPCSGCCIDCDYVMDHPQVHSGSGFNCIETLITQIWIADESADPQNPCPPPFNIPATCIP